MVLFKHFDVLQKLKSPVNIEFTGLYWKLNKFQRRKRDSNPRRCDPQQFSRLPHSTTLPFLLWYAFHKRFAYETANIKSFFKYPIHFLKFLFVKILVN